MIFKKVMITFIALMILDCPKTVNDIAPNCTNSQREVIVRADTINSLTPIILNVDNKTVFGACKLNINQFKNDVYTPKACREILKP